VGGYLAHSLAIITDAAHMLSDIAGFLVGVLSIFLTSRAADPTYSFGYHIAEVRKATGPAQYNPFQDTIPPTLPALQPVRRR
jgi:hypothetical protein